MTDRPLGRAGPLRRHRRPRVQEDLPGAARHVPPRHARRAGRRRGAIAAGASTSCEARAHDARRARRPASTRPSFAQLPGAAALRRRRLQRRRDLRRAARGARRRAAPAALPRDPAEHVPDGRRGPRRARAAPRGARVVVEKPFGRDLASARALNRTLHAVFAEAAIFRIDHYLGKEPVQNLLYFRFANSFLEPIWNRHYVAERADHDGRELRRRRAAARFYEEVGAIRDVVQNHLLQVVALLAMERAGRQRRRGDPRREGEGLQVDPAARRRRELVRGQFRGYRDEPGVAPDSQRRDLRRGARCTSTPGAGRACRSSSAPASACR